tara:strand:+ start:828 stop:1049 length:222 start_codon:yes stop_codon:yes gene_type:complete
MKHVCKKGVDRLDVSDNTKSNLKAGCDALGGAAKGSALGVFGNSSRIGDEKPNHTEKVSRDQEKADSMKPGQA